MIPTIYPYGVVNIKEVLCIEQKHDRYYLYDKCGRWRISEDTFKYLEERGFKVYGRETNVRT